MCLRENRKVFRMLRQRGAVVTLVVSLVLLAPLFYLGAGQTSFAADKDKVITVKAGYFNNGDFMHKGEDGDYEGYDVAYYYALSGYANWRIKFVEFDNLDAALAGLKSGKIDVLSGMSKTPERENEYLISNAKMCTAHIAVQVRTGNDKYDAGDTKSMKNMTCGMLAGSNIVELYRNWCKNSGITPHIVEYDTLDERNTALKEGKVDAIAAGSTIEGAQKIAEFPSLDLYFMFNRGRTDLKTQADRAMSIMSLQEPTFTVTLFEKYFPSTRNTSPSFSAKEKRFIKENSTVKVALMKDDAPFSLKESDGSIVGILPEYYAHLSKRTGIKFKLVAYEDKDKACKALSAGEVDMIGKMGQDVYDANRRQVMLSNAFLNMNLVRIIPSGQKGAESLAVPQCNSDMVTRYLSGLDTKTRISTYKNSEESLNALKHNKVDGVVCTQTAATWMLIQNRASEYVVTPLGSDADYNVCCAISPGTDGNILRSIINKTIAVDNGYGNQVASNYIVTSSAELSSIFNRMSFSALLALSVIIGLLLILAIISLIIIIRRRKAEHILSERKAELTASEKVNEARHEFFGAVSHDMRTPLNGIVGFTDMALKSDDADVIKDYLSKIKISGSILSNLVNDTLIMSRVDNGTYRLETAPVYFKDIVSELIEPLRMAAESKGVDFIDDISMDHDFLVNADKISIQKVYMNILSNAVKFTPEGGKVIFKVSATDAPGNKAHVEARIEDNGEGISKEFIPDIFEPFTQEDRANAGRQGNGLGLSIVKNIVDAMGGAVKVASTKDKGTVFTVDFDLEETDEVPETEKKKVDHDILKGQRALICEDNELNLEIMETILEDCGMEVHGFENGKLGLDAFASSEEGYFDIVLLDLRMPVMDGISAATEIRSLDRNDAKNVPVIAVSAEAYKENIAESLKAGMNAHVAKPIDPESLIEVIASLIEKK